MSAVRRIQRCPGCGVILQSLDETLPGYVPQHHFDKHEVVICQRCYKLRHYGQETAPASPKVNEEFLTILKQAKKEKALIVYVLDLFTFESSFSPEVNQLIKGLTIVGVGNKRDLLPSNIKDDKLIEYIKSWASEADLALDDVIITTPVKKYNIDELNAYLKNKKGKKNVYVIGATSSGKSSLVNAYLRQFLNVTQTMITTSPFPGTTLRVIAVPLPDGSYLYDTPGYFLENSLLSQIERDVIKHIVPRTIIKPRTYQLFSKQSILIGGLARFDFVAGKHTSFTCYFSNNVQLRRTMLINADKTFNNLLDRRQLKPMSKLVKASEDLEAYEIVYKEEGRIDIGIIGLGWITCDYHHQNIRLLVPKGVGIYVHKNKI